MDLSVLLEPAILTEVLLQGFVRGSMYALMATGLSLIFGIMGVANFAHGELFMIGHDLSNLDEGVGGPQVPEILWELDLILEWLGDLRVIEGGIVRRPVEVDADIAYARDCLIRAVA